MIKLRSNMVSEEKLGKRKLNYRKVPKFSDAINFAVSHLKFKQRGQTLGYFVKKIANSEDPDLGLHCLPRTICPKT